MMEGPVPPARPPFLATLRNAWSILGDGHRGGAALLLALMVVGVVLDAIGVGLVLPVIALLTRDGDGVGSEWTARLLALLGTEDRGRAVIVAMGALVLVFSLKAAFRWLLASRQNRYAFTVQIDLSRRLFANFLRRPWAFHLQRNSATLVQSVAHEVDQFALGVVLPALVLAAESLVIVTLAMLLMLVEPVGGCVALVALGISAWLFHRLTTARAAGLGVERRRLDRVRFRQLQQGFGAVKEMKVLCREEAFVRRFERATRDSARVGRQVQTLRELPRITIELVAVIGLAALVSAMILSGKPIASVVPVIGLFAVAVLRLVPSVARILASIQAIGLGAASVATLTEELAAPCEEADASPPPALEGAELVALDGVRFAYPGARSPVLDGATIAIRRGETIGIVGASGSGKSTLVDLLLGLHEPESGRVLVGGVDVRPRMRWWRSRIGYVPQAIFLTDDTVRRNIAFGMPAAEIDEARLGAAIRDAQLEEFIASLPDGLETIVGERGVRISGGQRQRIGIARALYHDPAVLVLDEATSALDEATERGVMQSIDALHGSRTIVIVAHRLGTLSGCDRVLRVGDGAIREIPRSELGGA